MILFLTKDLMIQSNAAAAAKSAGIEIKAISSLEQLEQKMATGLAQAVFVDLQMPGLAVDKVIEFLTETKIQAIAFAQHVNEKLLESARGKSFDTVLTRGQFVNRLPTLVQQVASQAH